MTVHRPGQQAQQRAAGDALGQVQWSGRAVLDAGRRQFFV